jgi:hypothetical protein
MLKLRVWDQIVEQTLFGYFYLGNISNAIIFSKFNAFGEYKYFNFIENLPVAAKTYSRNGLIGNLEDDFIDDPIFIPAIRSLKIHGDERATIHQHPISNGNSSICYSVYIPERIVFQFGIGIDPTVWEKSTDGVGFSIIIIDQGDPKTVFSRFLDPQNSPQDQRWHEFQLNINEFAGHNVTICFVTAPGPKGEAIFDWAHWNEPMLLVRNET